MTTLSPDTHPSVEHLQMDLLRKMPAWRKLELMAELSEAVRSLAWAGLRPRHPDDSPIRRKRHLADLMLGPELAAQVYSPLPEEEE